MSTLEQLEKRLSTVRAQLALIASVPLHRLEDGRFLAELPGSVFVCLPDLGAVEGFVAGLSRVGGARDD